MTWIVVSSVILGVFVAFVASGVRRREDHAAPALGAGDDDTLARRVRRLEDDLDDLSAQVRGLKDDVQYLLRQMEER